MYKRGVLIFVSVIVMFSFIAGVYSYDLGPLIDQGFNTYLSNETQVIDDPVYQNFVDTYKDAGFTEEDLQSDLEAFAESEGVTVQTSKENKKTTSVKDADKKTEKKNEKNKIEWGIDSKSVGFWDKFLEFVKNIRGSVTGNAVLEEYTSDLELPEMPETPGNYKELGNLNGGNVRAFSFITGGAILNVPDWAMNGEDNSETKLSAEFSKTEGNQEVHHFDLKREDSLGQIREDKTFPYTRAVVYNGGYYLDEKAGEWKPFKFKGLRIRQTDWLLESASGTSEKGKYEFTHYKVSAALTISDYTDKDYAVFLTYICRKPDNDKPWECNDGKWVLDVVETGDVNYHKAPDNFGGINYEETDLDVSDVPNLLNQLGLSAVDVQPRLDDSLLFAAKESYEYNVDEIGSIDFIVANLGNKKLEDIKYEIDIGEKELADVINIDVPKNLEVGETGDGSVTLRFKEEGKWKFPISVIPTNSEVDTSDNYLTFNVTVGEPITVKTATDDLYTEWNREINYTIKEPFTKINVANDGEANVFVSSGTDKVRTVFGDYRGAAPNELPRAKIHFEPVVSKEAISRDYFASAIHIGMELLAGDKEVVKFYMNIKNEKTGRIYTTPAMESNYKYYYKTTDLIPDFEFCTEYSAEVFIVSNVYDALLFNDPKNIIFKNEKCMVGGGGPVNIFSAGSERKLKLEGDYVVVAGAANKQLILPLGTEYYVNFKDPVTGEIYKTPENIVIGKTKLFKLSELFPGREIDFENGETFEGKVVFPDIQPDVEQSVYDALTKNIPLKLKIGDKYITTLIDDEADLELIDAPIRFVYHGAAVSATRARGWESVIFAGWRIVYPKYYEQEVIDKINSESLFGFAINDITTGDEVYRVENIDYENFVWSKKHPAKGYKSGDFYGWETGSVSGNSFRDVKPFLDFEQGHFYELYPFVTGERASLYSPAKRGVVFYIDGYQIIANNPLLRTRFLNMHNAPISILSTVTGGIPRITIKEMPDNLVYNPETEKIEKIDISEREIKLKDLFTISINTSKGQGLSNFFHGEGNVRGPLQNRVNGEIYREGIYEYEDVEYVNDGEYIYPLFEDLTIQIVPVEGIKDKELSTRTTLKFNCKVGKFDAVCQRGNYGYTVGYIDEVNGFLYWIDLKASKIDTYRNPGIRIQNEVSSRLSKKQDSNFIVRNRDNPRLHDSVVYDILSEIDRNPIESFELKDVFEKEILKPGVLNVLYEPILYEGGTKDRGDYPLIDYIPKDKRDTYENWAIDEASWLISDREIDITEDMGKASILVYSMKATVRDFDDGNKIVAEKEFDFSNEETVVHKRKDVRNVKGLARNLANLEVSKWFYSLGLEPYKRYSVDTEFIDTNSPETKITSYPLVFTHRPNYEDLVLNKNNEFVKKIPELNSTLLPEMKKVSSYSSRGERQSGEIPPALSYINGAPQQLLYDQWQADEFYNSGPLFRATFVVDPEGANLEDGEQVSKNEFENNLDGENSGKLLNIDKAYQFEVYKMNNIYDWYLTAPSNDLNTLDTDLRGVICYSSEHLIENTGYRYTYFQKDYEEQESFMFPLFCVWGNMNDLSIYHLQMNAEVDKDKETQKNKYSEQWPNKAKQDDIRAYVETVLAQYLKWYEPTDILNTTFQAYY